MLLVTRTSHQLYSSAQSLVPPILDAATGARELAEVARYKKLTIVLQWFNIVSVAEYVDEGIQLAIIYVLGSVMMMIVVSATASVK